MRFTIILFPFLLLYDVAYVIENIWKLVTLDLLKKKKKHEDDFLYFFLFKEFVIFVCDFKFLLEFS